MKRICLILFLCIDAFTLAEAQQLVTEVIPLGYRTVNEIIPVVRPLVSPAGSVTGLQGQLVVTATSQQLMQIHKTLDALDRQPARLMISVRRGDHSNSKQGSASVQGRSGNISVNTDGINVADSGRRNTDKDNTLLLQTKSGKYDKELNITQQVQVLEGREAFISTGTEIPVRNRGAVAGPGGVHHFDNTEFYPAVTGFYAIPRLKGDEIFLEINTLSRKLDSVSAGGRYPQQGARVSSVSSSVAGKLGEWIAIGNVDESGSYSDSSIAAISGKQVEISSQIYVKIEKVQGR